jgi:hypothetical protein
MAKKVIVTGVTETTVQETVPNNEFETVLYDGNGTTQTIELSNITGGVDFVWVKARDITSDNVILNSITGINSGLITNSTSATNTAGWLTSFNSNGFTANNSWGAMNESSRSYVAWCASLPNHNPSNTDGTITSETKSNSFMSVVSYTGTGANATVGHGLSSAPELLIVKARTGGTYNWRTYNKTSGATMYMNLDETAGANVYNQSWNSTEPTSSVFSVGTDTAVNGSGNTEIAYCFTSVAGKCKVGSYNGTGASGNAIDCGFEPQWVMIKRTDSTADWMIVDLDRGDNALKANSSNAEYGYTDLSLSTDGFILNGNFAYVNASGGTYIYIAIAKDTLQDTQQYDLEFAEQLNPPTGVALPSKEVLVSTTETYNPTDNDFDVVGTATKSGRAMKLNLVAEEADATITTNPVVNLNKEP